MNFLSQKTKSEEVSSMKNLAVLGCLVFFVSFYGCHATGGGVHIDWGEDQVASSPSGHGTKTKGGPPPHAPAHGYRAKHAYRYYPCERVYFDTGRGMYFYLEGSSWQMSVSLPSALRIQLGDYVSIEMDSDKPYTHHEDHKRKYPPGQMKEKKKGKKW